MPVREQSEAEQKYRKVKAYLMYPDLIETACTNIFKILDVQKTGNFKRDDLVFFISLMNDQLEYTDKISENEIDKLFKQCKIADGRRMTESELRRFMKTYLEVKYLEKYKTDAGVDY